MERKTQHNTKTHPIKTFGLALGMTAGLLSATALNPAWAASPKTQTTVSSAVTVGDVFSDVEKNADHVLAPAPALGKTMTLGLHDLNRIAQAFDLNWQGNDPATKTVIKRAATTISHKRAKTALEQALAHHMNGENFEMELFTPHLEFVVAGRVNDTIKVYDISFDPISNSFTAALKFGDKTKTASGRLFRLTEVPVLSNRLNKGDIIRKSDIEYMVLREDYLTSNTITNMNDLIGQSARRGLMGQKPVASGDVEPPVMVQKGDLVIMTLKKGPLSLTTQGKALDDGAKGEIVRILNTTSRQTIEATVTGPQKVNVSTSTL